MVIYENYDSSLEQLSEYYLISVIDIRDSITKPLFYKKTFNVLIPYCLIKYDKVNNSDKYTKSYINSLTNEMKIVLTKMGYSC